MTWASPQLLSPAPMPYTLARELEIAIREWDGGVLRPFFGWRGAFVGRRLFCCFWVDGNILRVWTKLPEPHLSTALDRPAARPHPFHFRQWLEIQVTNGDGLADWLPDLHRAYEWVRDR
ncbi:MAG: hypothetical protein HY320_07660 [Armatimonadetes bacterium]|nr:hypothetical protein [Armatimonadota bacterium]